MSVQQPTEGGRTEGDLQSVAGFRLLRQIGQGGMSTVFLSYDVEASRPVAVKLLADHLAHSREFVSRFYREARLSRLLSHPQVIQGLAAGYDPVSAKHYLILEYVDGPTAHSALSRFGRFPVGVAVKIGIDIANALAFMHDRQYVHRDVKPDNILLHPDGTAKLADLGLAKRLNDDAHLTAVSQNVGTSYYMSYEQSLNANLVDGRSDIFALGATLYHLLAGEVPFRGATHEEIVQGKQDNAYCPLRELNPETPEVLAEIIARTLACDPRNRFQTAAELANALEETGLATRIPALPQEAASEHEAASHVLFTNGDAPTRTDLKTPEQSPPPSSPDRTGFSLLHNPKGPTLGARFFLLALTLAGALGVGGFLTSRPKPQIVSVPSDPPAQLRVH
jgi:serine/threonine-protein kinase